MSKHLHLLITGGTIDSIFDPTKDSVVVNDASTITRYLLTLVQPHFEISQEIITMRDSREITDNVRAEIFRAVEKSPHSHILITHGTYTMAQTAAYLHERLDGLMKVVVLTGSMVPLQGFAPSDAPFNLGFAVGSLFLAKPGVYVAMNGTLFSGSEVFKNVAAGRFEKIKEYSAA